MTGSVSVLQRNAAGTSSVGSIRRARHRRRRTPADGVMVCKLCKRLVREEEGVFFMSPQTRALTDFQCRSCTRWELAPGGEPGNIRTDLVHHD